MRSRRERSGYDSPMDDFPTGPAVDALIDLALAEDRAGEDATAAALWGEANGPRLRAEVLVKSAGTIAGLPLLLPIFRRLDAGAQVETTGDDGRRVAGRTTLAWVHAHARALLAGERTALNFMQRLSGIATRTAAFVERTMATGVEIYDTRKTTPGLRALEKYAVRCGGGRNHRLDLAEEPMIKENHLIAAYGETGPKSIARAIEACLARLEPGRRLYVEVETPAELEAALAAGGARRSDLVILLDDFDLGAMRQAVQRVRKEAPPRPALEGTGGVRLDAIEALASLGLSRLSTGSITHSAPAIDISFKIRGPA